MEISIVQCEDLYELISCLLPEVTASPAQHCTYSIFGNKLAPAWVRNSVFAISTLPFFVFAGRFFLVFARVHPPHLAHSMGCMCSATLRMLCKH